MKKWMILAWVAAAMPLHAQLHAPDGVDVGGNYVYHVGFIDLAALTNDVADVDLAHMVVTLGQLCGVNPDTGELITEPINLLPVMLRSAYVDGEVDAGLFTGDAAGLTNIPASRIVGILPASALPTGGVWNAGSIHIEQAGSMTIASDLVVGGLIHGDGSQLTGLPAGGNDGSLQFSEDGRLEGSTDYFIEPGTGRLAYLPESHHITRVYKGSEADDDKLIYSVRRYESTAEVVLRNHDAETIRLRGDGNASISGTLEVGGLAVRGSTTSEWYIPQSGDLSMGSFTRR